MAVLDCTLLQSLQTAIWYQTLRKTLQLSQLGGHNAATLASVSHVHNVPAIGILNQARQVGSTGADFTINPNDDCPMDRGLEGGSSSTY
jgi:hypothetical protein